MNDDGESQSKTSGELLEADLEALDKVLHTLDIEGAPAGGSRVLNPALRQKMDDLVAKERQDAKENGWTAQARREIDEHRKEDGREDYNARRKADRASKRLDDTGELPRTYLSLKAMSPEERREHRRAQVAQAKAKHLANRTPAQIAENKRKKADAERERRERNKQGERPEGFGKF